jgi:hypothetical protein
MALSPYQASPTCKRDEAQHIPTSAQHGTKRTMQNTDATQQMTILDNTMLAEKLRAFNRAIVRSKPPIDSTSTTHSPTINPCRTADGYQSKACQPHSKVAKWTITQKIPPGPEGRYRLAAPAYYDTTKPQWEVTYLGWGQPSSRSRTAVFVPPVASPPLPPTIEGPPIPGLEESVDRQPIDNLIAPDDPSSSEEDVQYADFQES